MNITYTGFGPGDGSVYADYDLGNPLGWTKHVSCGLMHYDIAEVWEDSFNDSTSNWEYLEGTSIASFCADIYQYVDNNEHTVEIMPLSQVPVDGGSPMGQSQADLIAALWHAAFHDVTGLANDGWAMDGWSSQEAAGMQAAIWEIAFEGGFTPGAANFAGSGLNILDDTGDAFGRYGFQIRNLSDGGKGTTFMQVAWDLWKGPYEWCHNPLWGWDIEGGDYQGGIIPIPLPAPFALASFGLLGVLAGRRKLARLVG
jgi:hypothetical protein